MADTEGQHTPPYLLPVRTCRNLEQTTEQANKWARTVGMYVHKRSSFDLFLQGPLRPPSRHGLWLEATPTPHGVKPLFPVAPIS